MTPTPTRDDGLECSACLWRGYEAQAKNVDFPDEPGGWQCPQCGEPCAHTPIEEQKTMTPPTAAAMRAANNVLGRLRSYVEEVSTPPDKYASLIDAEFRELIGLCDAAIPLLNYLANCGNAEACELHDKMLAALKEIR